MKSVLPNVGTLVGAGLRLVGIVLLVYMIERRRKDRNWPLDQPQGRAAFMPVVAGGIILSAHMLVAHPVLWWIMSLLAPAQDNSVPAMPTSMRGSAIGIGLALVLFLPLGILWLRSRDHRSPPLSASSAVRWGVAVFPFVIPLIALTGWVASAVWQAIRGEAVDPIAHSTLAAFVSAPRDLWWWLAVAGVCITTPIIEETIFRGTLQGALKQFLNGKAHPSILISSLVFTLMHTDVAAPAALPALLVLSLALGLAYERTGRLITPILIHGLFNLWNIVLAIMLSGAPAAL